MIPYSSHNHSCPVILDVIYMLPVTTDIEAIPPVCLFLISEKTRTTYSRLLA